MSQEFLGKTKPTGLIAAIICLLIAFLLSYFIYSSEYKYTNDKNILSSAITEYTSSNDDETHLKEVYVLETREVDGTLIAFFKDIDNPDVFGFARLLRGIRGTDWLAFPIAQLLYFSGSTLSI